MLKISYNCKILILSFVPIFLIFSIIVTISNKNKSFSSDNFPYGVCPPFYLLDEDGNIINTKTGENTNKPYSPKKTCGKCHNYEKITEGYHFTQGKGEEPTPTQIRRYQWALTPGNLEEIGVHQHHYIGIFHLKITIHL